VTPPVFQFAKFAPRRRPTGTSDQLLSVEEGFAAPAQLSCCSHISLQAETSALCDATLPLALHFDDEKQARPKETRGN
jgi:hypothetical protein